MGDVVHEERVQWLHVALSAAVVLLVLLAQTGDEWVATLGWLGTAVVTAWWLALLWHSRGRKSRHPRSRGD